ncbi:MAG: hypothetical protein UU43_C0004G0045 [Candidatus Falkowbacteria bacterium GW2011_GWA2_41_14]|uniref:Uncharacterized protein n=1 Tax=Candidatus Falkowbacteria bacterium GW2011_GWA2_41_14 TaxID=1618635 RepID=A0A0G0XUM5_9BACT|nr:MAG: hypothetical protein UU43_C0004G0045 [Candidatus Falkowbacteria bacterium GW2011_GWA2_41_14]
MKKKRRLCIKRAVGVEKRTRFPPRKDTVSLSPFCGSVLVQTYEPLSFLFNGLL